MSLSGQKFANEARCLKVCAKHGEVCAEHERHSGSVCPPQQHLEYRKLSPGGRGCGRVCEWHILLTFASLCIKFFHCAFFINGFVCLSAFEHMP